MSLVVEVGDGSLEADPTAPTATDGSEYLRHRRCLRDPGELTRKVLLQRLSGGLGTLLQPRMDVFREITDKWL